MQQISIQTDISKGATAKSEAKVEMPVSTSGESFDGYLTRASAASAVPPQKDDPPLIVDPPTLGVVNLLESTGEVKPNEPNAQAKELDSKSKNPQSELAGISLISAQTATASTVLAILDPKPEGTAPVEMPAPTVLDSKHSLHANSEVAQELPNAADQSVGTSPLNLKIRTLNSDEMKSLSAEKPSDEKSESSVKDKPFETQAIALPAGKESDKDSDSQDSNAPDEGQTHKKHEAIKGQPVGESSQTKVQSEAKVEKTSSEPKPVDRHLIARQVADRIELMAATRPKGGVVVQLQPADLGSITLILKGDKNDLQAQVYSENDRVREALRQAHPALVRDLGTRGVTLTSLAVSTENSTSASLTSSDAWKQPAQQQQQQSSSSTPAQKSSFLTGDAPLSISEIRQAARKLHGVDVWI